MIKVNVHSDVTRQLSEKEIDPTKVVAINVPVKLYNKDGYHECSQVWYAPNEYFFVNADCQLNELAAAVGTVPLTPPWWPLVSPTQ